MFEQHDTNIFPLLEKNISNAKNNEIVLNPKTSHITLKTSVNGVDKFLSPTKELEAEVDSLIQLKDDMFREYMSVEDDLQSILKRFLYDKELYAQIRLDLEDIERKLVGLQAKLDLMLAKFSEYYKNHYDFLYRDIKQFMRQLAVNTTNVVKMKFTIDELEFLYNDYKTVRDRNNKHINDVKNFLSGRGVDV